MERQLFQYSVRSYASSIFLNSFYVISFLTQLQMSFKMLILNELEDTTLNKKEIIDNLLNMLLKSFMKNT